METLNLHFTLMQQVPSEVSKSLYQMWLDEGNVGTVSDFMAWLKAKDGINGMNGKDGLNGQDGKNGLDGQDGKDGLNGLDGKNGVDGVGVSEAQSLELQFIKEFLMRGNGVKFEAPSDLQIYSYGSVAGVPVYFGSNTVAALLWDFGDGQTSDLPNPEHIFKEVGEYPVTLTATNVYGTTKTQATVKMTSPIAITPLNGVDAGIAYPMSAQASANFSDWAWDFGDGQTSTEQNPLVTYSQGGSYTVQVTATTPQGYSYSATQQVTVNAGLNPNDVVVPVDAAWVTDNGHYPDREGKAAFDGINDGAEGCFHSAGQSPVQLRIDWPTQRTLTGFELKQVPNGGYPSTWTLLGSNDNGETWTELAAPVALGGANDVKRRVIPTEAQIPYQSHLLSTDAGYYVTMGEVILYEAVGNAGPVD